jgi:hypothetical protein
MEDFMIPMNKDIVKNKTRSIKDYLYFLVYFNNFYFYHNFPFILTSYIILYFLKGPFWYKAMTYMIAGFSSWFFHWLAHQLKYFNLYSGHQYHHQEKTTFLEDVHEFVSDMFAAGIFLMIINFLGKEFGVHLFNDYVLLFFMIAFPMVHLFTYHKVLKKSYHQEHHEETSHNFSPDFFDHIFNTNLDHRIEDNSHMVPIFLCVGVIVILIQRYKVLIF